MNNQGALVSENIRRQTEKNPLSWAHGHHENRHPSQFLFAFHAFTRSVVCIKPRDFAGIFFRSHVGLSFFLSTSALIISAVLAIAIFATPILFITFSDKSVDSHIFYTFLTTRV